MAHLGLHGKSVVLSSDEPDFLTTGTGMALHIEIILLIYALIPVLDEKVLDTFHFIGAPCAT